MKFTIRTFLLVAGKPDKPLLTPLTLDLPTVEEVRDAAKKVSGRVPEIDVEIESEDGTVHERSHRAISG
jgi:hypothetical protein